MSPWQRGPQHPIQAKRQGLWRYSRQSLPKAQDPFHATVTAVHHLKNEIYTGTLVWDSKDKTFGQAVRKPQEQVIRTPNSHATLVSREDFERVQQLLGDRRPKTRHPRTVTSRYFLSP